MADVEFTPAPVFRTSAPKAKMTVYFAMLIIALFAMLIACIVMWTHLSWHLGGFGATQGQVSAVQMGRAVHAVVALDISRGALAPGWNEATAG
jgi:hypothetical protein